MNRLSFVLAAAGALAAGASSGCSGTPAPTSSTITGSVAQASFPKPISAITVKSDAGKTSKVTVGADGKFSVTLLEGAGYQLFLGADGKSIPVVLKSDQARLQTQIQVKAGGASIDIGSVRYWNGAVTSEAKVIAGSAVAAKTCSGGVFTNSTQPCASGVAAATCSEEGDDEEESDGEHADDQGADCVDGIDSTTHQACDGGPAANATDGTDASDATDATDADGGSEMGVPESNAPDTLGCGDGEEGDGEEGD